RAAAAPVRRGARSRPARASARGRPRTAARGRRRRRRVTSRPTSSSARRTGAGPAPRGDGGGMHADSHEQRSAPPAARGGRRVLLAVSGGIAAYKAPELVRALVRSGFTVRCALTAAATRFVAPLALQTVSGHAVRTDLFDAEQEGAIDHITLADAADLVVVAPATAHLLARLAHGLADDLEIGR